MMSGTVTDEAVPVTIKFISGIRGYHVGIAQAGNHF